MRQLLAIPAASLLLLAMPAVSLAPLGGDPSAFADQSASSDPHTFAITSSEAATAMSTQIRRHLAARLRGGFSNQTLCSGQLPGQQALTATTKLQRWRCTLELRGARFPSPCQAEAYVSATDRAHRARVDWLTMSRYCRDQ
ncbi:MAG: hypothetical protein ABSG93_08935 [Solirubrobacteraceae bacterium]|jgi:hypothetical protein